MDQAEQKISFLIIVQPDLWLLRQVSDLDSLAGWSTARLGGVWELLLCMAGDKDSQEDSLVLVSEGMREQDRGVSVRDFRNCPTLE